MGTVTVEPEQFTLVFFDAAAIEGVAARVLADLGLGECDLVIRVDETSPTGRTRVVSLDPITVEVESGAIENPRSPRSLSERTTAEVLGRLLLRVKDRLDPAFADAPPDDALTLPESVAWTVYAEGRLDRLGYPQNRQRWLYHFRNRHGFTDAADRAFERLWRADGLAWSEIATVSREALAASGQGAA